MPKGGAINKREENTIRDGKKEAWESTKIIKLWQELKKNLTWDRECNKRYNFIYILFFQFYILFLNIYDLVNYEIMTRTKKESHIRKRVQ